MTGAGTASLILLAMTGAAVPWLMFALQPDWGRVIYVLPLAALLPCAFIIWFWRRPTALDGPQRWIASLTRRQLSAASLLAMALFWFVGGGALEGFWISDDLYATAMQAETFSSGRLSVPAPPLADVFSHWRFRVVGDVWVSQYPPGWALILTPLAWLGLPLWLAPGLFGAGVLVLFWRLACLRLDPTSALLATAVLGSASFFVLNASTLYSHISATFFGLLAVLATAQHRAGAGLRAALLAGAAVGAMGLIRPFNAAIFIAVLAPAIMINRAGMPRGRRLAALIVFALGGVPFAAVLLAYQYAMTDSALTPVTTWMGAPEPVGQVGLHTSKLTINRFAQLALTSSPVLSIAAIVAPLVLWRSRRLSFTDLIFPVTVLAFFFYGGGGGASYGPRYFFEAFPYLVSSAAACLGTSVVHKGLLKAAALAHIIFQLAALPNWIAIERAAAVSAATPFRLAKQRGLIDAVVILQTRPGRFRQMIESDLTRNGLDVRKSPVIFAVNCNSSIRRLRAEFASRSFWVFRNGELERLGEAPLAHNDMRCKDQTDRHSAARVARPND